MRNLWFRQQVRGNQVLHWQTPQAMTFRTITHDDWIAAIRHARKWRTERAQAQAQARAEARERHLPSAPVEMRAIRQAGDGGNSARMEEHLRSDPRARH